MIVATHQPHYLPWLGYLDRMQKADLFVVLDHVQFERRNYQNRTHILLDGLAHWLTVPVVQASQLERVIDKRIDNPSGGDKKSWGLKHFQTLRHAYRDAPFFDFYETKLFNILNACPERLVDIDQMTLNFLREALGIHTPLINSSALNLSGARSELILNLCQMVGADTYLAGMGGSRTYLDQAMFAEAGIKIAWQQFQHPVYSQCGGAPFRPGLSAIDLLFNHGPQSRDIFHHQTLPQRVVEMA